MKKKIDKNRSFLSNKYKGLVAFVLCISFLFAFIPIVQAVPRTLYVATTGSDTAAGDYAHPFKTIQKAVDVAVAGDTVYIRGGTYYQKVAIQKSGTAGNPITIAGYASETAIIDGSGISLSTGYGLIHLYTSKYITIKNLIIQNSQEHGIGTNYNGGSSPSRDITVYSCTFRNIANSATNFWQDNAKQYPMTNILVSHCSFSEIQTSHSSGECVTFFGNKDSAFEYNTMKNIHKIGVGVSTYTTNFVIDHNTIDVSSMESECFGIYIDGSQSSSGATCSYITISNNLIYGSKQGMGFSCEQGSTSSLDHITIVNNVVYTTANCISCFFNAGTARNFYDFTFKHNTIYASSGAYCLSLDITASYLHNFVVANNIFASSGSASLTYCDFPSTESDLIRKNNLYYRTSGTPNTQFSDGTNKFETSAIKDNPDFVSLTSNNFHLTSTSPAIDAGTSTYASSYDYDDNPRPHGAGYDIGAYEYYNGDTNSGNNLGDSSVIDISKVGVITSSPLDTTATNGWENFTCVVTDNVEVSTVILKFTNPDQSTSNVPMIKKTGTTTYYAYKNLNKYGKYSYRVQVTDINNNVAFSSTYTFLLPPNWDIDTDGVVTILDLVLMSNHLGQIGSSGWIREDVDNNGIVQQSDIQYVSNNFGDSWLR